ncbi:hypothetical protein V1478_010960 [Vespula squamosa]|uniref:Uncharacterized protein n=1 Tax=Vespula squamosa TaxID=30214 RepID=A0ABD2AFV7_VESSQ
MDPWERFFVPIREEFFEGVAGVAAASTNSSQHIRIRGNILAAYSVARCWHTGDCVCLSDPTLGRTASPASLLVLVGTQVASGIDQRQLQMPMIM